MRDSAPHASSCAPLVRSLSGGESPQPLRRAQWFLLAALIVAGAGLRLYDLAGKSIWYDEAATVLMSQYAPQPERLLDLDYTNEPPLFPVLVFAWRQLVHTLTPWRPGSAAYDFMLRLLPCLAGVAGIPATFAAARLFLRNNAGAFAAAFLFTFAPFQVYYAQELRNYTIFALLGVGAFICFLKALERDTWRWWAGLTALLTLNMWNHHNAVWNLAMIDAFFALTFLRSRRRLPKWIICHLVVLLACVPTLRQAFELNELIQKIPDPWTPPPDLKTGFLTFKAFFAGYAFRPLAYWPLFLLASAMVAAGAWSIRKRWAAQALWASYLVFPIAANVALWSQRDLSFYAHRLFIISGVMAYIMAGKGLMSLRPRAARYGGIAAFAVFMAPCLAGVYDADRLHPSPQHRVGARFKIGAREAARFVRERANPQDVVVHASNVSILSFYHYLKGLDLEQHVLSLNELDRQAILATYPRRATVENAGMLPKDIHLATHGAENVWYVSAWWQPLTPRIYDRLVRYWLDGHFYRRDYAPFYLLSVYGYAGAPGGLAPPASCIADRGETNCLAYPPSPATPDTLAASLPGTIAPFAAPAEQGLALRFEASLTPPPKNHGDLMRRVLEDAFERAGGGKVRAQVRIVNATPIQRTAQLSYFTSAHVVNAWQFTRSDPRSEAWRLGQRYVPGEPGGLSDAPAMVGRALGEEGAGAKITAPVKLPAGRYGVYLHHHEVVSPLNDSRGAIEVTFTPQDGSVKTPARIGTAQSHRYGEPGAAWTYRKAGVFESTGSRERLDLILRNPQGLTEAWVDVSAVVFIPESGAGGELLHPQTRTVTLPPETERIEEILFPMTAGDERLDVVLVDPAAREVRHIYFRLDL